MHICTLPSFPFIFLPAVLVPGATQISAPVGFKWSFKWWFNGTDQQVKTDPSLWCGSPSSWECVHPGNRHGEAGSSIIKAKAALLMLISSHLCFWLLCSRGNGATVDSLWWFSIFNILDQIITCTLDNQRAQSCCFRWWKLQFCVGILSLWLFLVAMLYPAFVEDCWMGLPNIWQSPWKQ